MILHLKVNGYAPDIIPQDNLSVMYTIESWTHKVIYTDTRNL